MSERAEDLAFAALAYAEYYPREDGSFVGCVVAESETADLAHPLLRPPGDHPPNRGLLMVLSPAGPEPLRGAVSDLAGELDAYAVLYDGVLRDPRSGEGTDAVLAEVGVRGEPVAHLVALLYRPKKFLRRFKVVDGPVRMDVIDNLLAGG